MNGNGESWTENKGQKWFCKIIKYLKTSPVRVRVCSFWLMVSPCCQPECQLWLLCSPFATTGFGAWVSFSFPSYAFSLDASPIPYTPTTRTQKTDILSALEHWTKYNEVFLLDSAAGYSGHRTAGELVFHRAVPEVQRKDTAGTKEHPTEHYSCAHRWPGRGAGWDPRFFTCQLPLILMLSRASVVSEVLSGPAEDWCFASCL